METEMIKQRLSMFGLLRESFKTLRRNAKLMLPVLVLVVLLFSYLEFAQVSLLEPASKDFTSQLAEHPIFLQDFVINMHQPEYHGALEDIRKVILVKLFILTLSLMISIISLVATISSSSEAYTAKVQNMTEMIMQTKQFWKKPVLTTFYMVLLTLGSIFLSIVSIGVVSILAVGSWAYLLYGFVFLCFIVLWIYFGALGMMSLVVSVLEEAGGLGAIARCGELMKVEKVKAFTVVVFFYAACGPVYFMRNAVISQNLENWWGMVMVIVSSQGLLWALKLFVCVVFTVFYHEQKGRCEEKAAKTLYLPVVGGEV